MAIEKFDGGMVITGEHIHMARMIARYAKWKLTATFATKFNTRPRKGWTIAAFNKEYGQKCKTWQDIHDFTEKYKLEFTE